MIALALLLIPSASALNVEFCVEFQSNFVDVDGGEDHWTDNANQICRGVWLSVDGSTSPLSDDPIHRLDSAASMLGTTFVDAVDNQKHNGQDH